MSLIAFLVQPRFRPQPNRQQDRPCQQIAEKLRPDLIPERHKTSVCTAQPYRAHSNGMARLFLLVALVGTVACADALTPTAPTSIPTPPQPSMAGCYTVLSPPLNPRGYQLVCPGDPDYDPSKMR